MRNKITAFIAASLLFYSNSHAQQAITCQGPNNLAGLPFFPASKQQGTQAKTTATDVRLISMVHINLPTPNDSITLGYSGARGGVFNEMFMQWNWKNDVSSAYQYNSATSSFMPPQGRMTVTYDAEDKMISGLQENKVGSAWVNYQMYTVTYDAADNFTQVLSKQWNSTTWVNLGRQSYTYTATNKCATYLYEQWNSSWATWENNMRYFYTWNTDDKLIRDSSEKWAGVWAGDVSITHIYDGTGKRIEGYLRKWNGTIWDLIGKSVYSGFVAHNQPETINSYGWNATTSTWENSLREHYEYNSYGKPDYYYREQWFLPGYWEPYVATRYHYETYTTAVAEVTTEETGNIYPIPANQHITVDVAWPEAQQINGYITDARGRTCMVWNVTSSGRYTENIPLTNMAPGNYVLTLQGGAHQVSRSFSIVR